MGQSDQEMKVEDRPPPSPPDGRFFQVSPLSGEGGMLNVHLILRIIPFNL